MIQPRHDKDSFFKYYTAHAVKLTLQSTTRKWSTPLMFNDPFDNQFDLDLPEPNENIAREAVEKFNQRLSSPELIQDNQHGSLTPALQLIQQVFLENPGVQHTEEELRELTDAALQGMRATKARVPETNREIRKLMSDVSIFCLSETRDNLLMWSHYANNHTGAVVEFLPLPEVDSPLICAQPVRYSEKMPKLDFSGLISVEQLTRQTIEMLTLTKSNDWGYEKEWRIVAGLRDKSQPYEILPYAPEEVGSVYLGCKMNDDDKKEIIDIVKRKYPTAKIFQAEKHPSEFRLVFTEII